ncbi:amidase [Uliginosibacterium sp. TH139]|uniref:amidase n=1 Tax=Uliginosibacterium sp. TH139 TaxID=2067453 RepID=UPI001C1F67D8|nr:amidase [Uliginosibacterium sp. TH139]
MQIEWMKARDIACLVRGGEMSAQAIAAAVCDQVERENPALNALIYFDRAAVLAEAAEVDARLAAGEDLPLAGVPFTTKDNLWVGDLPATFGSRLFKDFVAPRDSWCVARLRALGGVMLGITNCAEFACMGITNNMLHGVTRNPLDLNRTPGGSSGGAVAAVAAGMGPLALATDAGGSTRRPAAHTGLVGFKPTLGAVPNPWGFDDPSHMLSVIGQVGRDVEDVALMFDALADFDARDPLSQPDFAKLRAMPTLKAPLPRLRIAFSLDLGCDFAIDDDVAAAMRASVERLRAAGWQIDEASPEWPASAREYPLLVLQQAELAAMFSEALVTAPEDIYPNIADQIRLGQQVTGSQLAAVLMLRDKLAQALAGFFEQYDLLLCPTSPVEAWPVELFGPPVIGGRPAGPRGHAAYTPLFNYCNVPAVSIPCGKGRQGLPVGLQIVGPRYADALVLAAAWQIEKTWHA